MNNQRILQGKDAVNGKYGYAFVTIEGSRYELFYLVDFEATVTQHKATLPRLGAYLDAHKVVGGEGKFTGTMRYITDVFRNMIHEAIRTKKTPYFDMQITNDDPDSGAGRHTDIYKECTLDSSVLSKIDVKNTTLEEPIAGTYDDVLPVEQFTTL